MSRLTALRLAVAATLITACTGAAIIASQKSAATMQKAATQFLDSLSPDQKAKASFPFESEERLRWHFIPNETFPRKGLMIKDMNEAQRRLAHDLLRSGLSARGYLKVTLDHRARRHPQGDRDRRQDGAQQGRVSVLGVRHAGGEGPMGLARRRPSRLAALRRRRRRGLEQRRQLADVPRIESGGSAGRREEGPARAGRRRGRRRALVLALPADLQKQAIVNPVAPSDILTMNKNDITPLPDQGVAYARDADRSSRRCSSKLIEAYTSTMEADLAAERMAKIKAAGMDKVRFRVAR